MFNLDLFFKLCLIEINKFNTNIDKNRYKIKYSNEYYLKMIYFMFNDVNNWKFLKELKIYNSNYKYHYKTIYNKFREWSNKNVFKNAFYNFYFKLNTNLLLIDASSINNKYGNENVTINPEFKKKKITKLSFITNKNGFIYSVLPFDIKNKYNKYSTSVHDVKMINSSLNEIKNINNNSKYFTLIGDKAYKTKDLLKLNNKVVKIITPDKKNTKNKINKFKEKKLKLRIKIENIINNIKKYERVKTRKERKINYYMSWVYISCLINNLKC